MMEEWWRVLRSYSDEVKPYVRLILCDDASRKHPLFLPSDIQETFKARLFRLKTEEPWKEMCARNICMKHADGWVMMTDPDFIFCERELRKVLNLGLERGIHHHFASRAHNDPKFRRLFDPGNMGLVHKDDFWLVGGYDEGFAGAYGFSDTLMWRNLMKFCGQKQVIHHNIMLDHYTKGSVKSRFGDVAIKDATAPSSRKETHTNRPKFDGSLAFIAKNGWLTYKKALKPFRFPYEEVT